MNVKKLSKTIVTALAITVLGVNGLGLTAYAHEGEAIPIEIYRLYNPYSGEHHYTEIIGAFLMRGYRHIEVNII